MKLKLKRYERELDVTADTQTHLRPQHINQIQKLKGNKSTAQTWDLKLDIALITCKPHSSTCSVSNASMATLLRTLINCAVAVATTLHSLQYHWPFFCNTSRAYKSIERLVLCLWNAVLLLHRAILCCTIIQQFVACQKDTMAMAQHCFFNILYLVYEIFPRAFQTGL